MAKIRYRSPELVEKRRRILKRAGAIFVVGTVIILTGLIFFLRMERFLIRDIYVVGTQIIEESSVHNLVNESLTGSYVWVVPKANTFIYSISSLEKKLIEAYPGILSLDVHRDGFQKVSIKIVERKPHALWCKNVAAEEVQDCYFVDDTGLIFAKAPYFSGSVYFVYKGKLDNETPIGAHILASEKFTDFEKFISLVIKNLNVEVTGVSFKEAGDFDLLLPSGAYVMLNQNLSYDDIYNNFGSLIKSEQFATTSLDTLEYIDMRFGNKIYFKSRIVSK